MKIKYSAIGTGCTASIEMRLDKFQRLYDMAELLLALDQTKPQLAPTQRLELLGLLQELAPNIAEIKQFIEANPIK